MSKIYNDDIKNEILKHLLQYNTYPVSVDTHINGFRIARRDSPEASEICLQNPVIIFPVQGTKRYIVNSSIYDYHEGQVMLIGVDMPSSSYVVEASKTKPYISMIIKIDMFLISELYKEFSSLDINLDDVYNGVECIDINEELLDAFKRLAKTLNEPNDSKIIAPMIIKEIHYLLLKTPIRMHLYSIACKQGKNNQILSAIKYLKTHYKEPVTIDMLAKEANMSKAVFHKYFKKVTSMSPIQYQKLLRLMESRKLIKVNDMKVSEAAFTVGYENLSQFTREYKRLFGEKPRQT